MITLTLVVQVDDATATLLDQSLVGSLLIAAQHHWTATNKAAEVQDQETSDAAGETLVALEEAALNAFYTVGDDE